MKSNNRYRKFQLQQKNIEALERENSRFKRVYSEYETMSDELWNLETAQGNAVPDDFIDAIAMQTHYLEEEIQDWLGKFDQSSGEIKN